MHFVHVEPVISTPIVLPRFIFTCLTEGKETRSAEVILALEAEQRNAALNAEQINGSLPFNFSLFIVPGGAIDPEKIRPPEAVALFDGYGNGLYSINHTRKFGRVKSVPSWAAPAKWTVCIHRGPAERIARQLFVAFGTKFADFVDTRVLREAPPPPKKRKPRKPRRSSSSARYMFT